jgi:hypothetical protein
MRKILLIQIFLILFYSELVSRTIIVGDNEEHSNLYSAAQIANAGDTILIKSGIYSGGVYIDGLKGNANDYIYIIGKLNDQIIFQGGNNAIQLSDPEFLVIENIIFQGQTGNGVNIDDGGDYSSPANNIIIKKCIFHDINATGNNDLLKMSGLDSFLIDSCIFSNGSAGGSGIDMVGCHHGIIQHCRFSDMGSNAIQAKGGTRNIEIFANYFENCGQRSLNLGGSTGLEFFRPLVANYEAAELYVYSNIIIGSVASIAYVGSVNVEVINNTIINPEKWVIRILQETVDDQRFEKCGFNKFSNNLIYLGNLSTETNVGPNTSPGSFTFTNNFWYNHENLNWQGPYIPVEDPNQIINLSPEFEDIDQKNFMLQEGSPAIGYIKYSGLPDFDHFGNEFKYPRSAGAIEFVSPTFLSDAISSSNMEIFPNPASDFIEIYASFSPFIKRDAEGIGISEIKIYNIFGECLTNYELPITKINEIIGIDISDLLNGIYFVNSGDSFEIFVVMR